MASLFLSSLLAQPVASWSQKIVGERQLRDISPPTPPRGIQTAAIGSNKVSVHWIASMDNVGVAGYRIYRCPGDCQSRPWPGSFVPVGKTFSELVFVDATVRSDTEYTYLVTAFDAAGNESSPGLPPKTPGWKPLMHDHQPHTLPPGYTAGVKLFFPASVAPGESFQIRRVLKLSHNMFIGHSDLHYRTNNDEPYRQWAFSKGAKDRDATATVTAPKLPGNIFFYAETHLKWPGMVGTDESPFCSPWYQIMVTKGKPLDIQPVSLLPAKAGQPYKARLTAVGEISGRFRWGISHGGRLPFGFSMDMKRGVIEGVPSLTGDHSFTVIVEANSGAIARRNFTLTID